VKSLGKEGNLGSSLPEKKGIYDATERKIWVRDSFEEGGEPQKRA